MIEPEDPKAEKRREVERLIHSIAEQLNETYRFSIELAQRKGNRRRLSELRQSLMRDRDDAIAPLVKIMAQIPPPPIIIRTWFDEEKELLQHELIGHDELYLQPDKPSNKSAG